VRKARTYLIVYIRHRTPKAVRSGRRVCWASSGEEGKGVSVCILIHLERDCVGDRDSGRERTVGPGHVRREKGES
jgi:hypothetical protein